MFAGDGPTHCYPRMTFRILQCSAETFELAYTPALQLGGQWLGTCYLMTHHWPMHINSSTALKSDFDNGLLAVAQKRCYSAYNGCRVGTAKTSESLGDTLYVSHSGSQRNQAKFRKHHPFRRSWCLPRQELKRDQHGPLCWLQVHDYFWDMVGISDLICIALQ